MIFCLDIEGVAEKIPPCPVKGICDIGDLVYGSIKVSHD